VVDRGPEEIDGIVRRQIPAWKIFSDAGIEDSVELLVAPAVRIEDLYVRPDWRTGAVRIQVNIQNAGGKPSAAHVAFSIGPASSGRTLSTTTVDRELPTGDTLDFAVGQGRALSYCAVHLG